MSKNAKELVVVLLAGAGTITAMWGAFATEQITGITVYRPEWPAIITGIALIAVAASIGFLVKSKS
jgi:uncharacterized integral membrane protein